MFEIPEKMQEHFREDGYCQYISNKSIERPTLTCYWLKKLFRELSNVGLDHFCVHIMVVMYIIASEVVKSKSLILLVRLMSCDLYEKLNMAVAYEYHHRHIDELLLNEADQNW